MKHRIAGAQNVSRMCAVCGRDNPWSLKAHFYELENGELLGEFEVLPEHQSYPGRLHGGISSAMLDETIGRAINISDAEAWGVTVELSVRFRKPVPIDGPVHAVGRITRDSRRLFEGSGEIVLEDGTVAVEATGRYMKMPIDQIAQGDFEAEWFADVRPMPESIELADTDRDLGNEPG
ncbi:MAG: PaaI family thioesterase [Coriobacteriia bacterium]